MSQTLIFEAGLLMVFLASIVFVCSISGLSLGTTLMSVGLFSLIYMTAASKTDAARDKNIGF